MDLEQYIANYQGGDRVRRLLHIFDISPDLRNVAAKLAIDVLKQGTNTGLYKDSLAKFQSKGVMIDADQAWVDGVDEAAKEQKTALETALGEARANQAKEDMRVCFNKLGQFFLERGDFTNAMKNFVRTRDFCTKPEHQIDMCLNCVQVTLEMGNLQILPQWLTRSEGAINPKTDKPQFGKLQCATGFLRLNAQNYKAAAHKFLDVPPELAEGFNRVISGADIATYAGILALASFSREELKAHVMDNQGIKAYLELSPDVRDVLNAFYESRYKDVFPILKRLKPVLQLDMHLAPHVENLMVMINERALQQYVSPFVSADLHKMARAFDTDVDDIEKRLATLITSGSIRARIDSHNKVVYARRENPRAVTLEKALGTGTAFLKDTESTLRRLTMIKNCFEVAAPQVARKDLEAAMRGAGTGDYPSRMGV